MLPIVSQLALPLALALLSVARAEDFTFKYTTNWYVVYARVWCSHSMSFTPTPHSISNMKATMLILCRLDSLNWENGTIPTVGDTVRFPDSFSSFNLERCTSADASDCVKGGVTTIRKPKGKTVAEIRVSTIELPLEGDIVLVDDTDIYFVEVPAANERVLTWVEREYQYDFRCAANWVKTGSTSNPDFRIPCHLDTATFPDVRSLVFCLSPSHSPRAPRTWLMSRATRSFRASICLPATPSVRTLPSLPAPPSRSRKSAPSATPSSLVPLTARQTTA
jgi:hypothetical protein